MHLHPFKALYECASAIVVPDGNCQAVLNAALDHAALGQGAGAWQPPAVFGLGAWLRQAFVSTGIGGGAGQPAFVLSPAQERALWETVIVADPAGSSGAPEQIARLAAEGWRLQQLWQLEIDPAAYASNDVAAYRRWSAAYCERTAALGVTDQARLMVNAPVPAAPLLAHGFVETPPVVAAWLGRAAETPQERARGEPGTCQPHAFTGRSAELQQALRWASHTATSNPGARVAVIADTAGNTTQIQRALSDVFGSDTAGCGAQAYFMADRPSLSTVPLLAFALDILALDPLPRWDTLSAFIRHPLLAGAAEEASARARFDASLRALERFEMPLAFVLNQLADGAGCPRLARLLAAIIGLREAAPRTQTLAAWLAHFDDTLKAANWPPDEAVDPQQPTWLNAWGSACDRLQALDAVLAPVTRADALARLRRQLTEARVPAPVVTAGVFVVPAQEALLLDPDFVWVTGCESDNLPDTTRLSPLLPLSVQREAGLPGSDPRADLWRTRMTLETLVAGAAEAHVSYAASDGDTDFSPSPLLPQLLDIDTTPNTTHLPLAWQQAAAATDTVVDVTGPVLAAPPGGGVGALAAQAACPFRAFARHRLDAQPVVEPAPGISARHKGIMIHRILARIWHELGDQEALLALDPDTRAAIVARAIGAELTPLPFETAIEREIFFVERDRLAALLGRWLEFEAGRDAFTVIAREHKVNAAFAGLEFSTRLDRADRRADGSIVIIDYKTGHTTTRDWDAPRLNEPQLPYYALTAPFDNVAAIAFAEIDVAKPAWREVPAGDAQPGADWAALLEIWRADLEALAAALLAGDALPDPKNGAQTCRYCEQQLFCRRVEFAPEEDAAESTGDGGEPDV